ncbi:MAG: copper resistance protein NlpE N-terminal domain-containing protein [Flavobacteriales bacterium]|nr:copper resistance protein NlpE N-terminal domain-containing protein [Flavobacteriales bacterium]
MRSSPILVLFALLVSCGSDPVPTTSTAPEADTTVVDTIAADWPGYYTDTLPCSDCPGIETTLWVRSDSSFVLQQRYLERDSIPVGTMGQWHVVNGLLTVGYAGDKPEFYRYTAKGLLMVDEMGAAFNSALDHSLDKLADEIGDAIPRMRLSGNFTYMADALTFQPCGTRFPMPCVGGMDMGEEEGEPLVAFTNEDLQKAYAKAVKRGGDPWTIDAVCTIGMGPAMEGDGADEYIFIEEIIGPAQCP